MKTARASQFRRGFKTEAEAISLELRSELGLRPYDPLDPFALADHLEIPIVSLDDARASGLSVTSTACLGEPREGFDAITVCAGTARLVVYNHRQPPTRQANTIAHELSHVILEHPFGVSTQLFRWRVHGAGVIQQLRRRQVGYLA